MSDITLNDKQQQSLREERDRVNDLLSAHQFAWWDTVKAIKDVRQHIADCNYGLADKALESLLEQLPHDFGAQEFTPMIDEHFEKLRERRASRS